MQISAPNTFLISDIPKPQLQQEKFPNFRFRFL